MSSIPHPGHRFATPQLAVPSGKHYQPSSYQKLRKQLKPPPFSFLGFIGELLITLGVVVLLFVVWELYYTNIQAGRVQDEHRSTVLNQFNAQRAEGFTGDGPDPAVPAEVLPTNDSWGFLYVPRLGNDFAVPIVDGTSDDVIDGGVMGRYENAVRPGEEGNLSLAGHRQTYGAILWYLDRVRPGDKMYVQTANGFWVYETVKNHIVQPTAVEVLAPNPLDPEGPPAGHWLTLTTCHPPYTTLERMITHAEFVDFIPLSEGPPEEIAEAALPNMSATDNTNATKFLQSSMPRPYEHTAVGE